MITDGEFFNCQKVIQKVDENNVFNRIFTIGLGQGADPGFLKEMFTLTICKSDFVFSAGEQPVESEMISCGIGVDESEAECVVRLAALLEVTRGKKLPVFALIVRVQMRKIEVDEDACVLCRIIH